MQFSEIIGQIETKQRLVNLYRQNRLSHALLFLGKEGSGALSLAIAFAQFIVCEKVNGKKTAGSGVSLFGEAPEVQTENEALTDACGLCPACQKAAKLIHPDIHFSFPTISIKKDRPTVSNDLITEWRNFVAKEPYGNVYDWLQFIKAENRQGNITALECEEIIRKISLKSFESSYKVLIMWMPEFLGKEGNKLLKLIEEPPPDTLFLFVAESEQQILPTILSRTQLVKIPLLHTQEIAEALVNKQEIEMEQALQIAAVSEGNYHEALSLIHHTEENWETLLRDWLNSIVKGGPAAQLTWIDEVSKFGREKQKQFLRYFIHLLEHSVRQAAGITPTSSGGNEHSASSNLQDFATRFNRLCNISQLSAIITELDTAIYHIERNGNAKILFHALTIRIYRIISDKSVILVP